MLRPVSLPSIASLSLCITLSSAFIKPKIIICIRLLVQSARGVFRVTVLQSLVILPIILFVSNTIFKFFTDLK